jgi:hypothetical protein
LEWWAHCWLFDPCKIKIEPNEKAKQHKIGANRMEFQNVYVLQFVKSFTLYDIKCVCPKFGWAGYMFKNLDENKWKSFN